ncbi:MAG TPA: efflux RND transporter permease subunit [Kofleriaceae bacterium]|nr:efflux RND transporter permease subunit [Kofleriaceae bacterium]
MKAFIDVFIRRWTFALTLTMGLIVFGLFSYPKVGVDLFPSVEFPFVSVTVVYPGADPASMEDKVAKPIEDSLSSMAGIKRLTTINLESVTQVLIEFELEVNGDQAVQDVRDKLGTLDAILPKGIESINIQKFDVGAMPIMSVALSAPDAMSPRELTRLAEDVVKERIQRIPGVGAVDVIGGREREIHVEVDPGRLEARGLTPADVAMALQGQNLELPAGRITEGTQELVVTTKGAFSTLQEIADAPIVSGPGFAVRIGDVAAVKDDMAEKRSHASVDGKPAIALVVQKTSGANTVAVAEEVKRALAELGQQLTEKQVAITITQDNAPFIEKSFHEVQFDLALGALLAVIIVFGFLRDPRATFISALALPTSVIATIWFLNLLGFTFNMMTMLALSLSIGLLIDDAIVVIENIHRHMENGKPPMEAASTGTAEIALAVLATTLSIVAVFLPVATMKGLIGRFFLQFGVTVSVAVMVSLFVSFTLTPMLSARLLKVNHGKRFILSRGIERVLDAVDHVYRGLLGFVLRSFWTKMGTFVLAMFVLIGSCGMAGQIKNEFLPEEDRSQLSIDIELPVGTSLAYTTEIVERIAADVRGQITGIDNTYVQVGGGGTGKVNMAKIYVNLVSPSKRTFTQQHLMAWARERYGILSEKGLKVAVNQVDMAGGDSGFKQQAVQFNLRSNDMDRLIKAAGDLQEAMRKTGKFVDLDSTYSSGKPQIEIDPDRAAAKDLGVPVASIATTLRALAAKDKVTDFKDPIDLDIYDVKLTLSSENEQSLTSLSNLTVRAASNELVPLSSVVKVERGVGPSEIDRQARMRQITVLANLAPGVAQGESATLVEELAKKVVPADIVQETSGNAEMMQESFGYMLQALVLAIILVYMILAAQFNSLIHPLTIMLSLPFAVVGAFGGLIISGANMSIFGMIGLIMLMGLVTKNAILLVDYANHKKEEGLSTKDALMAAGPVRLRPILMTTAAMVLGMMPVALALGEGGEGRAPMAIVVIGGLITSTALTLVVVPIVYSFFEWVRHPRRRKPPAAIVVAAETTGTPPPT